MEGEFQRGKQPAEAVARVVVDAIESPRPRPRYRVGIMAKALIPAHAAFPTAGSTR